MPSYYLDSSALVKHYVAEAGSHWLETAILSPADSVLLTSRISAVEIRSALARRRREATIQPQDHADIVNALRLDCQNRYRFVELEPPVIDLAGTLLDRYPLRAYDAVQLSSALLITQALSAAGLAPPVFLCADERLLDVARREGMVSDNPNSHP